MKVCFTGLSSPIEIGSASIPTLEVHNRVLFARICESLLSGLGEDAAEPYTLWDNDGQQLKPQNQFLFVCNPLCLPWDSKDLAMPLFSRMEGLLHEDDELRRDAEETFRTLCMRLSELALQLQSEYAFEVDWDLKRYLKSFGFSVDIASCETLLDRIILFLMTAKDVSLRKVIVFVNLKLFLSNEELESLFEHIFFLGLDVLLIENVPNIGIGKNERKHVVDHDFLEFLLEDQTGSAAPLQEGICSNGFGAVSS